MAGNTTKWAQKFVGQVRIMLDAKDRLLALAAEFEALGYGAPPAEDGTPAPGAITDEELAGLGITRAEVLAAMQSMVTLDGTMTADGHYANLYRVAG